MTDLTHYLLWALALENMGILMGYFHATKYGWKKWGLLYTAVLGRIGAAYLITIIAG